MQTVVIAFLIKQKKRCRSRLAFPTAFLKEMGQIIRKALWKTHDFHPAIGNPGKMRIQICPQVLDYWRQRIGKILVFSVTELETRHIDSAAEWFWFLVKIYQFL